MFRIFAAGRILAIGVVALVAFATPSFSQQAPSGTIRIEVASGGFILGLSSGSGTVTFQGREYAIGIGGLSLGATIGFAKTELIGRVYNLSNIADISGTYTAGQAGLALAGGKKRARLRNAKGVVLRLHGRQIGFEATVDLSGMEIWLK